MNTYLNLSNIDPKVLNVLNGNCVCGFALPLPGELLSGVRDNVCPNCKKDNSPFDAYWEDEGEDYG
jgi:hypothetical protein